MDRKGISTLGLAAALAATMAVTADAATPRVTAWTNGQWFDGAAFRRVDVYSVGDRLTLKRPKAIDETVDLAGGWVTGAFGEAHNHNIPGIDTAANIRTYLEQGIVPRLPTAVLSMGLMIVAVLSVSSGLVLDTVTRGRREMKLLAYLSQPAIKRD